MHPRTTERLQTCSFNPICLGALNAPFIYSNNATRGIQAFSLMPNWTREQLKATKAGAAFLNLGSTLDYPERKHGQSAALVKDAKAKHRRKRSVGVSVEIIRLGRNTLDSDNLVSGGKPLRDAIARSLGIDDGDERIRWHYGQCTTDGDTGTIVRITLIER